LHKDFSQNRKRPSGATVTRGQKIKRPKANVFNADTDLFSKILSVYRKRFEPFDFYHNTEYRQVFFKRKNKNRAILF
jgi:hypothetical protein